MIVTVAANMHPACVHDTDLIGRHVMLGDKSGDVCGHECTEQMVRQATAQRLRQRVLQQALDECRLAIVESRRDRQLAPMVVEILDPRRPAMLSEPRLTTPGGPISRTAMAMDARLALWPAKWPG